MICAAHSSVPVRRRGLAARIASRAAVTRAVVVITAVSVVVCFIGSSLVCFTGSSFLPDIPGDLVRPDWCGGGVGWVVHAFAAASRRPMVGPVGFRLSRELR